MPSNSSSPETPALRRSSLIELSLVLAAASGLVGGTIWATKVSVTQQANTDDLRSIRQEDLPQIRALIEDRMLDRWSFSDMQAWVDLANREAEVWALESAQALGHDPSTMPRLTLPRPVPKDR